MENRIETCVVGSYPVTIDKTDLMNSYYNQQEISWNVCIKETVTQMLNAGIDIISDGQTRDPIVQIFTRRLGGCRVRDRTEVIGKIEYKDPITIEDMKYVRNIIPKKTKLLGLLTGPFTLCQSSRDMFYNDEKKLAFDFAHALKKEAEILQKYVDIISIDEPFFSNILPDYGQELIRIITKNISSCPTRLHVCGDVSNIVPDLLDMPVDILSHEFKASPHLFDTFNKYDISKNICLGSVRSDDSRIEPVKEITEHILKGIGIFGKKIVQLSPDCGQRFLPKDIAYQKLKNLVKAGEIING